MQSDTYIPRRLDDQWKLGFWDADVAFPFVFFLFLGWMSGTKWGFVLCSAAGFFLSRWISRTKADKHPAFAMHWAYWALPTNPVTALRATPPLTSGEWSAEPHRDPHPWTSLSTRTTCAHSDAPTVFSAASSEHCRSPCSFASW